MAISTFDSYLNKLKSALPVLGIKSLPNTTFMSSAFVTTNQLPGVAPTTAVACDNTLVGALWGEYTDAYTNTRRIGEIATEVTGTLGGAVMICDRLSHQGGISAAITGEQTTNLPTAALTRSTDGKGVMIGLEVHSALGSTASTITVKYTNQDGVPNRVTKAMVFGGGGNNSAGSFRICPLQDGDTGVLSVQSVNIAGSVGTGGNVFGVVLFKPLTIVTNNGSGYTQVSAHQRNGVIGGGAQLPVIPDNACLFLVAQGNASSAVAYMHMKIIED